MFVHHEGDHFRTRLTHTIEVAQIARALARALKLDDDLAEAVALGHDLGHTPFGHTGEDALDACMADDGGFDHNSHALRIVTELERALRRFRRPEPHRSRLSPASSSTTGRSSTPRGGRPSATASAECRRRSCVTIGASPSTSPSIASLEAQAAALADDIAYDAHDIDDGLRAGLFTLADIRAVPFIAELMREIEDRHPGLEEARVIHELTRRVITRFIEDAIGESRRRIAEAGVDSPLAVASAGGALVGHSAAIEAADRDVKAFLFARMYRHPSVLAVRDKADAIVRRLFAAYMADPSVMPAAGRPRRDRASGRVRSPTTSPE